VVRTVVPRPSPPPCLAFLEVYVERKAARSDQANELRSHRHVQRTFGGVVKFVKER